MTIRSIQKVIKIGSSTGVTLPAKDLKRAGLQPGDEVEISVQPVKPAPKPTKLDAEYQAFKKQYGNTLKNLTDR